MGQSVPILFIYLCDFFCSLDCRLYIVQIQLCQTTFKICLVYELNRDTIGASEQIVRTDAMRAMISGINRTYGFRTEDAARYAKAIGWSIDWVIGYEEGVRKSEEFLAAICSWARDKYDAEKAVDIIVDKTERKKYQPLFEKTPEYAALMAEEK